MEVRRNREKMKWKEVEINIGIKRENWINDIYIYIDIVILLW
jgi:hypothetical protein